MPPTPNPTKFCCVAIRIKYFQCGCPRGCPHWLNFIHITIQHYLHRLNFSTQIHVGINLISPHHTWASLTSMSFEFGLIFCHRGAIRFSTQIHVGINIISPHHTLASLTSMSIEFGLTFCHSDTIRKFVMV